MALHKALLNGYDTHLFLTKSVFPANVYFSLFYEQCTNRKIWNILLLITVES